MGAVYKRKKHSCKLCKPHKMGLAPKEKPKAKQASREALKEMRKHRR